MGTVGGGRGRTGGEGVNDADGVCSNTAGAHLLHPRGSFILCYSVLTHVTVGVNVLPRVNMLLLPCVSVLLLVLPPINVLMLVLPLC